MNIEQLKFRGIAVPSIPGISNWVYGSDIRVNHTKKTVHINGSEVDYNTVGQFIGLTDIDKREIYDGDLIDVQNGTTDDYPHFLAQIHRHGSSFNLVQPIYHNTIISEPVPHFIRHTGKVLGNIHEHKHLVPEWEKRIKDENKQRLYTEV